MKTNKTQRAFYQPLFFRGFLAVLTGLFLIACDNVPTEISPNLEQTNQILSYTGPSCSTTDACTFKVEFWNKMVNEQCANCHDTQSNTPRPPFFMESRNVNDAYTQALTVVDLGAPANSTIVSQIQADHNCGNTGACAALATNVITYIENWANGGESLTAADTNAIVLTPPAIRDTGTSRSFPTGPTRATVQGTNGSSFENTIWPLLTANCSSCHQESSPTPQAPYFAENDVEVAYDAVISSQKINLDDPAISRLVVRLDPELHNCWDPNNTGGADCPASASLMLDAITLFRDGILLTEVDGDWITSKALDLTDGILASGGARDDSSTIALYEMKTGSGNTLYDTSGVEPALNLSLSGSDYSWVGGWGIEFVSGNASSSAQNTKLRDHIVSSGEYSIEAWVVPANVNQGDAVNPARIISYTGGNNTGRNFTLGQAEYHYVYMNRKENGLADGTPSFITSDEDLQASQQHVVATYHPVDGRKIYVNGINVFDSGMVADIDPATPLGGSLTNWDGSFAFILGTDAGGQYQWQGKLRLVAIHDRVMTPTQVLTNFDAGVGEKFYLMFSVSDLIEAHDPMVDSNCFLQAAVTAGNPRGDQCFIYMEVSQFDSYSYLFYQPIFISKNPAFSPASAAISYSGMRIGLNGKEPAVGQAFTNIGKPTPLTITANPAPNGYCIGVDPVTNRPLCGNTADGEQALSDIGTIIALEKGAGSDEFFLTFEEFGIATPNIRIPRVCGVNMTCNPSYQDTDPVSDIGLRTFDEINATMSAVTGISPNNTAVKTTFDTIKQQLPSTEDINTFLSAHEIGVAQLAIEYCSALVDDTAASATYFPGFGFTTTHADANFVSDVDWQNLVITPLMNNMMGTNLTTQPDPGTVSTELLLLITNPADDRLSDDTDINSNDGIPDGLAKCGGSCDLVGDRTQLVVKATCAALLGSAVSLVQ